jgi:vacuolar protein sorting-associated protein 54
MTQVFAAINHGLSEEYGKIELPHQEAKDRCVVMKVGNFHVLCSEFFFLYWPRNRRRLLADARYLHQKLSALKNVGTPSGMLVTVVSEKSLPRAANVATTPSKSSTFQNVGSSANQRLKGLLSGRSSTFDKALPTPVRSSPPTPPASATPPPPPRTSSPEPIEMNKVNGGGGVVGGDKNRNGALTPTAPPRDITPSPGLDQVETPLPILDLDQTRAEYESGPTQTGLQTRLLQVMSPPLPPLMPDVPPAIASSSTPYLDNDSTEEGRVLDVPASDVWPSSESVAVQEVDA